MSGRPEKLKSKESGFEKATELQRKDPRAKLRQALKHRAPAEVQTLVPLYQSLICEVQNNFVKIMIRFGQIPLDV